MARKTYAVLGSLIVLAAVVAQADDYVLPAGETDTIALADGATTNINSLTVAGALTVTGDGWVKTPKLNLNGGTLTVDGTKASIGSAHWNNDTPTTLTVTNGADGMYGSIVVKNGTSSGTVSGDVRYNFSAQQFNVATNAADVTGNDGVIDILSITNAGVAIREWRNYSTLTARVSVAGTVRITRGGGYAYGCGIFRRGPARIDLGEGAVLTFEFGNQEGSLNDYNVPVVVTGTGNLVFRHQFNKGDGDYPMSLRKGAVLNNAGTLSFSGAWGASLVSFEDDDVIGPNITQISPTGSDAIVLQVPSPTTITVRDFDFLRTGKSDLLVGTGAIRIDTSAAPRTFRANIPVTYKRTVTNVEKTYTNHLSVVKTGTYEATISSTTNIPSLNVLEGAIRITSDCVISDLSGAAGTTLVADGCRVSVTGEARLRGLALETVNGGAFVKVGDDRLAAYDPGAIRGNLHVANGSVVFSQYGFSQKYWRWTFTKMYNGPKPLHLGRFWIFGTDGECVAPGMPGLSYVSSTTALSAGNVRWRYDASTNMALKAGVPDWQGYNRLGYCFRTNFNQHLNNFAYLSSPEIDPGNAASHLGFELRLKAAAKPVTGYNFMTVLNNDYATSWTVEASDDGVEWTTVETRNDVVHKNPQGYYFYDGENGNLASGAVWIRGKPTEYFHFTGYRRDGLATLADPLSVQVDGGATLDLRAFSDGQPINRIAIDLSAGGGTIYGGTAAASGTLALTNVAASGFNLSDALPLTVDGLGEPANLRSWTVVIDGASSKYKVVCSNGQLVLVPPGMTIIFR